MPEMKAAVYLGKQNVEIRDLPVPQCGDNDVLIRNLYSSICGTDTAVFQNGPGTGHRITVGQEFGHETVSEVVQTGRNITEFAVGDRVYPYPLYARDDRNRAGTLGGFSEYILCPNARLNHSLFKVDPEIPDQEACLIEPFTVGGRAARQAGPKPGEKAVIFGCGTIGIAAGIMLKYLGLEQVMICDHSDFRLSIARELGFETCNTSTEVFQTHACSYAGKAESLYGETSDIDIWIDAAGADSILDSFLQQGKINSRIVLVAVNHNVRNLDLLSLTYASMSIIGSGGYREEDVPAVMNIMKSRRWDIQKIITDIYPLQEIHSALEKASDPDHAFNVILEIPKKNTSR